MAAIDDLLTELGRAAQVIKNLDEVKTRLAGYRAERQRFADLVTTTMVERDAQVEEARATLRALADAINAAFPPQA